MKGLHSARTAFVLGLSVVLTACVCAAQAPPAASLPERINDCYSGEVVVILPTGEKDKTAQDRIRAGVTAFWTSRAQLLGDAAALKRELTNNALVAYGTMEGNLWLKQHLKDWPIRISNESVTTDRTFQGTHLRVLACWANPANPAKSLVIYTAQDAADVVGINGVFHGPEQFVVARETTVLQSGYYAHQNGARVASAVPDFAFPPLTQAQMLQDFEALASIIRQVFPLQEINRQVYGLDLDRWLSSNREQIHQLKAPAEFVDLIQRTIVGCRGSHFWISSPRRTDYFRGFVKEEAYAVAGKYERYATLKHRGNGMELPLIYFEGNYYTLCDLTCDGNRYPKGMKILTCNGKTPDAIVATLSQRGVALDWDYDLKKFYTPGFYKYEPLAGANSSLVMELESGAQAPVRLELSQAKAAKWPMPPRAHHSPQVKLVNTNILYIRLPAMDPQQIPFYREELAKYQGKTIRKVVIDIRNNGGGSDMVWNSLLSMLLKENLALTQVLAVKKSEINSTYLTRHSFGKEINRRGRTRRIDFLNQEEFQVLETSRPILPNAHSLKLGCKIYVLSENIYSSAGSLMNICKQSSQLVSVGIPNSKILGIGIDPFAFSLPESKLTFSLEPVVDLTDAQNARDTHHTDVEVRVRPTLDQWLDYRNAGDGMTLEDRLNHHDPFFQRVLEMN